MSLIFQIIYESKKTCDQQRQSWAFRENHPLTPLTTNLDIPALLCTIATSGNWAFLAQIIFLNKWEDEGEINASVKLAISSINWDRNCCELDQVQNAPSNVFLALS